MSYLNTVTLSGKGELRGYGIDSHLFAHVCGSPRYTPHAILNPSPALPTC